jgi:hypothetical protein
MVSYDRALQLKTLEEQEGLIGTFINLVRVLAPTLLVLLQFVSYIDITIHVPSLICDFGSQ